MEKESGQTTSETLQNVKDELELYSAAIEEANRKLVERKKEQTKEIFQYVRSGGNEESRGIPFGVLIAHREDDKVFVGWSRCSQLDQFDKEKGQKIARYRALYKKSVYETEKLKSIPKPRKPSEKYPEWWPTFSEHVVRFVDRAQRYFKVSDEQVVF